MTWPFYKDQMDGVRDCTTAQAAWCPNCGDCLCFDVLDFEACPLHGETSNHEYEFDDSHLAFQEEGMVPLPSSYTMVESERGKMSDEWVEQMHAARRAVYR